MSADEQDGPGEEGSPEQGDPESFGGAPTVERPELSTDELEAIERSYGDERTVKLEERKAQRAEGHQPGDVVGGNYEILEPGRRGGMGVVYKARDTKLGRTVALKRILTRERSSKVGEVRFVKEAAAVAALNHLNIVTIYAIEEDELGRFIVMEWVEGESLCDYIRQQPEGRLPVEEAKVMAKGIGQALAYAHRKGVIHRDVKPSNILLTEEGVPKLVDFGLARMASESELSKSGYGMGTLDYMPPEQRRDAKSVDHRADIYAFGATLYEMVTGRTPRIVRESKIPGELRYAILKAMEERPEDRYFSAGEMVEDIGQPGGPLATTPEEIAAGACPHCGKRNSLDVRFCKHCGAGLLEACPECGHESRVGLTSCLTCGFNIADYRKGRQHIDSAIEYLKKGRPSRAEKEAQAALKLIPDDGEARRCLEQAQAALRQIRSLESEASRQVGEKQFIEVSRTYRRLLDLDPFNEQARQGVSWARSAAERVTAAIHTSLLRLEAGELDGAQAILTDASCAGSLATDVSSVQQKVEQALALSAHLERLRRRPWLGFRGWRKARKVGASLTAISPQHRLARQYVSVAPLRANLWLAAYLVVGAALCVAIVFGALAARQAYRAAHTRALAAPHIQRGDAAMMAGNPSDALREYCEALEYLPDDSGVTKKAQRAEFTNAARGVESILHSDSATPAEITAAERRLRAIATDQSHYYALRANQLVAQLVLQRRTLAAKYASRGDTAAKFRQPAVAFAAYLEALEYEPGNKTLERKILEAVAVFHPSLANIANIEVLMATLRAFYRLSRSNGDWAMEARQVEVVVPEIRAEQPWIVYFSHGQLDMEFVLIRPGKFTMGDPDFRAYNVKITEPFLIGAHEVTQVEWRNVMRSNPSRFKGDKHPVEKVSWDDAMAFCIRLSRELGSGVRCRLPTEAEWEYACRAGTTTPFSCGSTISTGLANHEGSVARQETTAVGSFPANGWGLYDMHGNVWEWCSSLHRDYPFVRSRTEDLSSRGNRVARGGGWKDGPRSCESSMRDKNSPRSRRSYIGFRVVVSFRKSDGPTGK